MKVANAASADDVRVRLCFFVKVRNARGRRIAGGRRIGRTVVGLSWGGAMGAVRLGSIGWTGVPKAGEEDGIRFAEATFVAGRANSAIAFEKITFALNAGDYNLFSSRK